MSKRKLFNQEKGSVAIYAIATIFSFIFILGGIFFTSSVVRKNQLRTMLKIKDIYASDLNNADSILENKKNNNTSLYVREGLVAFYDAVNNVGNGHSNTTKVWSDLSGNGHDAIYKGTGEVTWNDKAYDFINPGSTDSSSKNYFETENAIPVQDGVRTIEIVCSIEEDGVKNLVGLGNTSANNALSDIMYNNGVNINALGNDINEGLGKAFETGKTYITTITYDNTNHQTSYYTNLQSKTGVDFKTLNTAVGTLTIGIGKYGDNNTNKRFKIQALRIYDRVLTLEEREQNYQLDKQKYGITLGEEDYVTDGLIGRYDAVKNTGTSHDSAAGTWRDLSGNNHDITLSNFEQTSGSGWTDNSLVFDGVDDFATIQGLDLSLFDDITICATYKIKSIPAGKAPAVVCSNNAGSGRLYFGYGNQYSTYIPNANAYAINFTTPDTWIPGTVNLAETR